MKWNWMVVLALASGCDGIDLDELIKQHPPLTRVLPEPMGAHCAQGGSAVLTGLDLDDDGVLADSEVTATEYVCTTPVPDVLVRAQVVPPGERCPLGGQVSRAGHDTNGNGVLEDGEITREVYGCTESDPVVTHVAPLPSRSGACFRSGSRVEAGPDLDRDGVLDDTERQASTVVCSDTSLVRVRQRTEPSGLRCPLGGTRVEAGADSNGNGELDDAEATSSAWLCHALRTYDGDMVVTGPADAAALQGISRIRGNLLVTSTALKEVVLPALMVVEGPMTFHDNPELARLELPGLRFVNGSVDISYNASLEKVAFGDVANGPLWVQGALVVEVNPSLPTLSGLGALVPAGSIILVNNDALEEPGSFEHLIQQPGGITVRENDRLQRLPFPRLERVSGDVDITHNAALPSLAGTALRTIGGHLFISGNDSLTDLSGLPELRSVTGWLSVLGHKALRSTEGLYTLFDVGGLTIADNAELVTAGAFPVLTTITNELEISGNPKLTSVGTFDIRSTRRLRVGFNPLLTDLSGLGRLLSVQSLVVDNNASLRSLAGFAGLRETIELQVLANPGLEQLGLDALERVDVFLSVLDNAKLPTCRVTSLASRVTPGSVEVSGNDDSGTCD